MKGLFSFIILAFVVIVLWASISLKNVAVERERDRTNLHSHTNTPNGVVVDIEKKQQKIREQKEREQRNRNYQERVRIYSATGKYHSEDGYNRKKKLQKVTNRRVRIYDAMMRRVKLGLEPDPALEQELAEIEKDYDELLKTRRVK